MYTVFKSIHCVSKNTHFVKLQILCLQYLNSFLRSNWKILHLANFFTQPAVVMVVTIMKYGGVLMDSWPQFSSTNAEFMF